MICPFYFLSKLYSRLAPYIVNRFSWLNQQRNLRMQRCAICQKQTDKCCSLCRKTFYCSPEHQQVHWHMIHKLNCEGKVQPNDNHQEDFKIYNQSVGKSQYQTAKDNQQDAKIFIELFEERLIQRKSVLTKYLTARQNNSPAILNRQLVRECIELCELSKKISQNYKASLSDILEESYGLFTNTFIIKMDLLLDKVMLARCYQIAYMTKELKQIIMVIGNETEHFPQHMERQFSGTYKKLLTSIIDVSEQANFDKITEKMYSNFIKLTEKFEGIWEQTYSYFNLGIWYGKKTYYQKAVKCFTYSLQLINSNKSSKEFSDNSTIFKGDALYNTAICRYSLGDKEKAIQNMQQSYRLRSQGLGKSSIEASDSLYMLSKWCLAQKKYENCLQFVNECLRIRKTNPIFTKELEQVNNLIYTIHQQIKAQKEEVEESSSTKNAKQYKPLENEQTYRQLEGEKKESFTKRLLQNEKEIVTFKFDISAELADTLSSAQWSKVDELLDLDGTKMEKDQAIRIIFDCEFTQSLNEEQKLLFIKLNKKY